MSKLSPLREGVPKLEGLKLLSRGKVRDTYLLPSEEVILQVATNGISIFDFVLNALIPMKGIILTAMSVFWFKLLESFGIKTHLVAYGSGIDEYLPENLRDNSDLQSRALVVKKLKMANVEFIIRNCLTGSGKRAYDKTSEVCGHKLPPGLNDGDELPCLLDTPTTKAEEGHDEHLSAEDVRKKYPNQTYFALKAFQVAKKVAEDKGIILADTKFEFAEDGTLSDEVLTPDSSRFWSFKEWLATREKGIAPPSYDKQRVREWGKTVGINKRDPKNEEDVRYVHSLKVPENIIKQTTQVYRYIFWMLTGMTIEGYLREEMKVDASLGPTKNIVIICGSESDLPSIKNVLNSRRLGERVTIRTNVISCHRNGPDLNNFVRKPELDECDLIIGVGGKALALPGIIDSELHSLGRDIRVAGVALREEGSKSLLAAQLSIEEIPGQPVIVKEDGNAYTGPLGLLELINRTIYGELPPVKSRTEKPALFNVILQDV